MRRTPVVEGLANELDHSLRNRLGRSVAAERQAHHESSIDRRAGNLDLSRPIQMIIDPLRYFITIRPSEGGVVKEMTEHNTMKAKR